MTWLKFLASYLIILFAWLLVRLILGTPPEEVRDRKGSK